MKKLIVIFATAMVLTAVLTACGGEAAPAVVESVGESAAHSEDGNAAQAMDESAEQLDEVIPAADEAPSTATNAVLSTEYRDALPVEHQLAFGTMQLEETDLAVTAEQAETILPYWRVLQSLTQSGNAADAEINAVIKQIQDSMNGEQIAAIAAMEMTEEKVQTMLEEGTLNFGFGRRSGSGEEGAGGGRPGGGPGGGLLGGGPGGGGPGGIGGNQDAFATRQAELEASGEDPIAAMMERMSANSVIRLLERKTGEAPERGFGGIGAAYAVVLELTGLSEEALGEAMAEGQTIGEVLEANGVSIEDAREAMMEAMVDVQLPGDQELGAWIDDLLSGSFGAGGQREG